MRIQGVGNHSHLLLVRKTLIPFSKAICKCHQEPLKSFYFLQGSSVYPLLLLHQLIHLKTKSIIYLLMAPKRDICACFGLVCSFILCLVFMFLIWMKSYGICLYLSDLFLLIMISSRSVLVVTTGKISFLFYSWVVFHCVCVCVCVCVTSSLSIHLLMGTGLFPHLGYCK